MTTPLNGHQPTDPSKRGNRCPSSFIPLAVRGAGAAVSALVGAYFLGPLGASVSLGVYGLTSLGSATLGKWGSQRKVEHLNSPPTSEEDNHASQPPTTKRKTKPLTFADQMGLRKYLRKRQYPRQTEAPQVSAEDPPALFSITADGIIKNPPPGNENPVSSARQVAYLRAILGLIDKAGSSDSKVALRLLSKSAKKSLYLGAYCLESGQKLYLEYANKINSITELERIWVAQLIPYSKMSERNVSEVDPSFLKAPKNAFGFKVMHLVYMLDLIRCYGPTAWNRNKESMLTTLSALLSSQSETQTRVSHYLNDLIDYAKKLCKETGEGYGSHRKSEREKTENRGFFERCRSDASFCQAQIAAAPRPQWD